MMKFETKKVLIEFTLDEVEDLIDELLKVDELLEGGKEHIEKMYSKGEERVFRTRIHQYRQELIKDTLTKLMDKSQLWSKAETD